MKQLKVSILFIMLISIGGVNALAQDSNSYDIEVDGIYYRLNGEEYSYERTAIVVNPNGDEWSYSQSIYEGYINIPYSITVRNEGLESWDYSETTYRVTAIGPGAFRGCSNLTSISLPESIKTIGKDAFAGCSNLASITVPSNFVYTEKVTSEGLDGFGVDIGLTDTKWYQSQSDGMVYLGKVAYKCKGMQNLSASNISIKQGTERIGYACFVGPGCWWLRTISIPGSVTSIGAYAFSDGDSRVCDYSTITIPSSVKSIGAYAFAKCKFSNQTLPTNLEQIGPSAFEGCTGFTDVVIPDNVKVFYVSSFSRCGLSSLTIGKGVRCILRRNWTYTNLTGDEHIYDYQYDEVQRYDREGYENNWYLTDINTIQQYYEEYSSEMEYEKRKGLDVQTIKVADGNEVFDSRGNCNAVINTGTNTLVLGSANTTIPNSVTAIGWNAFKDCSITTLTIPASVESIDIEAFRGSKLTSIKIPSSVSSVGICVLANCTDLLSVNLEEGISTIEDCAFAYSTNLNSLSSPLSLTQIGANAFIGTALMNSQTDDVVYVGTIAIGYNGTMPANKSVIIKDGTTTIAGNAFSNQANMASIHIPNTVKGIGKSAFFNCTGLTSLSVPASVESVGQSAFEGCSSLTSLELNCKEIGRYLFGNNQSIRQVTFGEGVETIGESAFYNCSNLKTLVVPNSITSVGSGAFYGTEWYNMQSDGVIYIGKAVYKYKGEMPDNTEIVLKDGTESITSTAFQNCKTLSKIELPQSLRAIGDYVFEKCINLKTIYIPANVSTLGYSIFSGCNSLATAEVHCEDFGSLLSLSSLEAVTIGNEVTKLGDNAFSLCSKLVSVTIEKAIPLSITRYTFSNRKNAILYVPSGSKAAYQTANYWKEFKDIIEAQKCATPTISLVGGKLHFECETEGVEFHYEFTTSASGNGIGNDVAISSTYVVKVYASKDGIADSDVATAQINVAGQKGDADGNGVVDIADAVHIVNYITGKITSLAPQTETTPQAPQ